MTLETFGSLHAIGMLDLVENDRRPTFVVDLEVNTPTSGNALCPVYYNECLRKFPALQQAICTDSERLDFQWPSGQSYAGFVRWASQSHSAAEPTYIPASFRNMTWDVTTVKSRWNVISARLGTRPYTSSFMETLLFTEPTRNSLAFQKSTPSTSSLSSNRTYQTPTVETPMIDTPSIVPDALESPHSRKTSASYFSHCKSTCRSISRSRSAESVKALDQTELKTAATTFESHKGEEDQLGVPASHYMQLLEDLRVTREELVKKTGLIDRISAIEAVAISVITADGELVFANDEWYRVCEFPKGVTSALAWMNVFVEEDLPKAYDVWTTSMINKQPVKFEARFKTPWRPPFHVDGEPDEGPTWVSSAIYPDLSEDGEVIGGTGCIMDVSEQKWLQRIQARKMDEALERAKLLETLQRRQQEAHASDIRFQRLADVMPIGIFISNKHRQPRYVNQAIYDMFPIDPDNMSTTMPWEDAFAAEDIPEMTNFWRQLIEEGSTQTIEIRMKRTGQNASPGPHGTDQTQAFRWVLATCIPEHDSVSGELKHITGCITDITNIKQAEELQKQRVKDVTDSRKQQEAFIDMTSHEIRNPLSSIVHSADEISHCLDDLPELPQGGHLISTEVLKSAREAADTILFCTQHSKRIVDDILTLSKLNSNLLPISLVAVNARAAIEQALKMFEGELRASDIDWELSIDKSLDELEISWVELDTSRILQILVNLIGNSVKFTQFERTRKLRVALFASRTKPSLQSDSGLQYMSPLSSPCKAERDGEESVYLQYLVQDTGCGISQEGQKLLFNRFTQDSARTHIKYGGSGLGLFISRQLCELQGGQMGFSSTEGAGSTFAFFIQTHRVAPPESSALAAKTQSIAATQILSSSKFYTAKNTTVKTRVVSMPDVPSQEPEVQSTHILLVEDNLINQKVLGQQLRKRGYIVNIANHGEEALSHIQTTRLWTSNRGSGTDLTIILMDIEMPVMNGMTCARLIRELQVEGSINSHIPIIAVTANARSQQVEDAIAAGMDDVISKPFRMPELVTMLEGLPGNLKIPP